MGDANLWCWIDADSITHQALRLALFYVPVMFAGVYQWQKLSSSAGAIVTKADGRPSSTGQSDLSLAQLALRNKLRTYSVVFVLSWVFGLLNRIVQLAYGHNVFILDLLEAIFVPLQGAFNACAYAGVLDDDSELVQWAQQFSFGAMFFPKKRAEAARRQSYAAQSSVQAAISSYEPKEFSIFSTTLNAGEAPLEGDVSKWIVKGHDVYIIGMQECTDVESFRDIIHTHLGGLKEYRMYRTEIGSNNTSLGFHGYIALTVFLRSEDVVKGHVAVSESSQQTMATGANLLVTTAANKGGVGIPIQIHDTSLGVLTAHLPSDSKGVSKLKKRNGSACTILRELRLTPEDVGFDLHMQHDHVLFMGDLNYRMDAVTSGVSALTGVAVACSVEKGVFDDDPNWMRRRYALLYGPRSSEHPSAAEQELIYRARDCSRGAWMSVLRADELRRLITEGEVFHNFVEPLPTFPPSYKRNKGAAGNCGDYTDPVDMINGFCQSGEVELVDDDGHGAAGAGGDAEVSPASPSAAFVPPPPTPPMSPTSASASAETVEASPSGDEDRESMSTPMRESEDVGSPASSSNGSPRRGRPRRGMRQSVVRQLGPNATKKEIKAIRPPSYTDRILLHSLEDRKNRIRIVAYDVCDDIRISDHRAVSMVLNLQVNAKVHCTTPVASNGKVSQVALAGTSIEFLELVVSDLSVTFTSDVDDIPKSAHASSQNPLQAAAAASSSSSSSPPQRGALKRGLSSATMEKDEDAEPVRRPAADVEDEANIAEVTIAFPLPAKDPLVTFRGMYELSKSLRVSSKNLLR